MSGAAGCAGVARGTDILSSPTRQPGGEGTMTATDECHERWTGNYKAALREAAVKRKGGGDKVGIRQEEKSSQKST